MSIEKLNRALTEFRKDSVQSRELLNKYKILYFKECRNVADLRKQLQKANSNLAEKDRDINVLRKKMSILRLKKSKGSRKAWADINSIKTKRRRITELKKDVLAMFKDFGSIKSAHVYLNIGQNDVNFSFFRKDLVSTGNLPANETEDSQGNSSTDQSFPSGGDAENNDEEGQPDEVDYSEIYDEEGKFTSRHLKKAVYVCDKYRISQEAYHELRMELKGHYPPIYLVKLQKNIMSQRIVYFPHDTVNNIY